MDVVFSNHALERMDQRAISKDTVLLAIRKSERTYPEADGDTKFLLRVTGGNIHVVCKPLPDENKWLVKSVWFRSDQERRRSSVYRGPSSGRYRSSRGFNWIGLAIVIVIIVIYILTRSV